MVFVYKKLAQFAVRRALPPRRSESPFCATNNKPSCVLHLLGWFIGSRDFSSWNEGPNFGLTPELRVSGSLNHSYVYISSSFPLANHFDLPGSQSIFSIPQDPSLVHMHLLVKRDSTEKACG